MDRRKTADVLFFALQCAKDDRLAFADAVEKGGSAWKQAMADVKSFETLQKRIFGTSESEFEAAQRKVKDFSVYDLKKLLKSNPEMFKHADGCECEYCRPTQRVPDADTESAEEVAAE